MKEKIAIWKATLKAWKIQAEAIWRDREVIKKEWRLLLVAFPVACQSVSELSSTQFFGPTKTQIAFQRVRYELTLKGYNQDDMSGALLFLAVSLAYFYQVKNLGKVINPS